MKSNIKVPKMIVIPDKVVVKPSKEQKNESYDTDPRPSFSISEDVFPAIKEWKTGQKYKLEIEVEQVGSEISDWGDNKGKLVNRFKICGIMNEEEGEKEDSSEYPKGMLGKKK